MTWPYRLALAAVAAVMVALPLVYLAILGVAAWAVTWHAVHNIGLLAYGSGGVIWVGVLVYVAPIVVGSTLVFFMLKPFLARPAPDASRFTVDERAEPVLVAFVARLCGQLRAPRPVRIDLDDQANASASLENGWGGFVAGRVVLTIGTPLVAGMTLQQLAGVLAHEFGHFAQGAGMRLSRVITAVNRWFARVVYARDEWDERLEAWSKNSDLRIAAMLLLARACIGATRFVLKSLMFAGHAVSCLLLRQMEFDADRHQCAVAGSEAFESTARRVQELSFSRALVQSDLQRGWNEGRLPDDLPMLVARRLESADPDAQRAVDETVSARANRWFDTHPATADRVRAAQAVAVRATLQADAPASALFADFEHTSRAFTQFYYEKVLELAPEPGQLVPLAAYLSPLVVREARRQALQRFFGAAGTVRLFPVSSPPADGIGIDIDRVLSRVNEARGRMDALQEDASRASQRCTSLEEERHRFMVAGVFAEAGGSISANQVGLLEEDLAGTRDVVEAIRRARTRVESDIGAVSHDIDAFRQAATDRLSAELSLLAVPVIAREIGDPATVVSEAAKLVHVVNAVHAGPLGALNTIFATLNAIATLSDLKFRPDAESLAVASRVQLGMLALGNSIRALAADVLAAVREVEDDAHGSLADALIADTGWHETRGEPSDLFALARRLSDLHQESMSRLAEISEAAVNAARVIEPVKPPG